MGVRLRENDPQSLYFWSIYWARFMRSLWSHLIEGVRTGQSVRKDLTGFAGFERQQQESPCCCDFNKTMVELTRLVASEVARSCGFRTVRTVVDVGGGYGELILDILRQVPHLKATLFDLSHAMRVRDSDSLRRNSYRAVSVSRLISSRFRHRPGLLQSKPYSSRFRTPLK